MAVAAGAATLILRPRSGLIEPAAVEASAYFSAEQLDAARDFRGLQRALGLAEIGLSAAALALLALWPPRPVRAAFEWAGRRPLLGAAAAGATISLALTVVTLPLGLWRHERAVDVGLSTQDLGAWLADVARAGGIGALFAGVGATLAIALIRRFPRHWWAPGAVCVVAIGVVLVYLSPIVLDPLFNRFTPLPRGELRSEVLALADRAGVEVGEVYRVDASRRTTGANAYVGGLGHTKRVVLYDNLIEDYPRPEVTSVVAHELAHVKHRDVLRGLAWLALVAPAALWLVALLTERIAARGARAGGAGAGVAAAANGRAGPGLLPALALSLALVSLAVESAGNVLSRRVEARADAFALELTRDPQAFIALERRLAVTNISEPDPPALYHDVFGTHPTTLERLGYGVSYERER